MHLIIIRAYGKSAQILRLPGAFCTVVPVREGISVPLDCFSARKIDGFQGRDPTSADKLRIPIRRGSVGHYIPGINLILTGGKGKYGENDDETDANFLFDRTPPATQEYWLHAIEQESVSLRYSINISNVIYRVKVLFRLYLCFLPQSINNASSSIICSAVSPFLFNNGI